MYEIANLASIAKILKTQSGRREFDKWSLFESHKSWARSAIAETLVNKSVIDIWQMNSFYAAKAKFRAERVQK